MLTLEMAPLDLSFWGIKTASPWTLAQYPVWSFEQADGLVIKLTGILGPDLVSTLVALAPSLVARDQDGATRMAAAQVVLLQRADSVRDAIVSALAQPGSLRADILAGVQLAQQPSHGAPPAFMPIMEGGKMIPGMFRDRLSVYLTALAVALENLCPLDDGGYQSRASLKSAKKHQPISAHLAAYWSGL